THPEVGLGGRGVVPREGVGRAEADGGAGVGERRGRIAGLPEGPSQYVLGVDRGAFGPRRASESDRRSRIGARVSRMVGLEAGQLEVAVDAVAAVEGLDRAHELVLPG